MDVRITEQENITSMRVAPQLLLDLKRQPLHAATHVAMARRDPYPTSRRQRDHGRNAFNVAATSATGAFEPVRTRAPLTSTTMTLNSSSRVAGAEGHLGFPSAMTAGAPLGDNHCMRGGECAGKSLSVV
jgi:hypothetical protein